LLRDAATLTAIRAGSSLETIKQNWAADLDRFKQRRERYLLYH